MNDADWRIYSFWKTVLEDTDWFVGKIVSAKLNLDEWWSHKAVCVNPQRHAQRDVGFSSFYMNRCNHSGVLNAGPIGGYEQKGKWRLDVRFNKPVLAERVTEISRIKECICISNDDAVDFLKSRLPRGVDRKRAFVYLDPPYVVKGQRLYMNAYEPEDHGKIARYVWAQKTLPWIMSYDDADLVRALYARQQIAYLPIQYSLQAKRSANELVIAPHGIRLPRILRIGARKFELKDICARSAA